MVEDPTMAKLEARQGIDINEPTHPPDMGEHQVNLPSRIINTLHNSIYGIQHWTTAYPPYAILTNMHISKNTWN